MDFKKLRIWGLNLDCLAIVLGIATLYLGNKQLVPEWVLVAMLVLAVLVLACAILFAFKARKIQNGEFKRLTEATKKAMREKEQAEA